MTCSTCSGPLSDTDRFCPACGDAAHPVVDRGAHYAAAPHEPVASPVVLGTLMPHLAAHRQHLYRNAVLVAAGAAIVAAAFGVLSVALVCAGVALPAALLVYQHDHGLSDGEPAVVVAVGCLLPAGLGALVGLYAQHAAASSVLFGSARGLPPLGRILELGVVVPVLLAAAAVVVPAVLTRRPRYRDVLDAVNVAALAGTAASLGFSIVLQHEVFTGSTVTHLDPARSAFIAITLGLAQPVLLAAAVAAPLVALARARPVAAPAAAGLVTVVAYELATTLLAPYGSRGVVLTALAGALAAAAAVLALRREVHGALLDGRGEAGARGTAADVGCSHCASPVAAGSVFCPTCGAATAAFTQLLTGRSAASTPPLSGRTS